MKIAHFSDTHGLPRKPVPSDADVIVLSGDICPNKTRGHRHVERPYQTEWLRRTGADWKRWAGDKPLLLVEGNHDFVDPAPILREFRVRAVNLEGREVEVFGMKFMGLPDIPWMGGEWNHERQEDEIKRHIDLILERRPDVLVSHSPIYGVLDCPWGDYHIGSTALSNALVHGEHRPIAVLHGHCHEMGSQTREVMGMLVSNAAMGRRVHVIPRR